jgi:transcriptional regulator with XRE-family HTH domain
MRRRENIKEIYKKMGEKIRKLRLIKGLSQKTLARYVGVTYQQIQNYERGKSKIPVDRLIRISEALEVPLDYFLKEFNYSHSSKEEITQSENETLIEKVIEEEDNNTEISLLKNYYSAIKSPKVRKALLNLIQVLAEEKN